MDEIKIGHVLKRVLKQKRKTLKEVARETEIPYSTLHTWRENRQPKDIRKAKKLATYLGLTLQELIFDQSEPTSTEIPKQLKDDLFRGIFEITVKRID